MPPRKRLGQLLTELGVIDEHQLQSALGHQKQWGGKLGSVLVQKGFCKEPEVVNALSKHLGMPQVKLAEAKVDPRAVKFVSKQIAEKLHVFPYELSGSGRGEVVTVAMSDPTDLSAVDQLAFHTGKRIKPMLAGDTEIVQAIQAHYAEEKKPATTPAAGAAPAKPITGQMAPVPPAPAATGQFPRRIGPESAAPASGSQRAAPYIPPPIPAAAPKPEEKLEEIEPDESISAPPRPEPVDLPEDDGEMMGLEPIAAHSQFGDEVAGREDVAGEGSAADAVEGLESASVKHEGVEEADRMEGLEPIAAHSQPPEPEGGWGAEAAPAAEGWGAEPPAAAWQQTTETPAAEAPAAEAPGWGDETPAPAAEPAQDWSGGESGWTAEPATRAPPAGGEELPIDAIIGTAETAEASGWGTEEQAPATEEAAPSESAPDGEPPPIFAESAAPEPEEAAPAEESTEQAQDAAPAEEPTEQAEEAAPVPEEAAAPVEEEPPVPEEAAAAPAEEPVAPDESAEAPDAWASSDDPLAAAGESAPPEQTGSGEPPPDELSPQEASAEERPITDKFAREATEQTATAETEAPPEWGDQAGQEESAAEPEEPATPSEPEEPATRSEPEEPAASEAPPSEEFAEEQDELKLEGWIAPPPEPEPQGTGWFGQALEATTPLSAADVGTLASIGVDPNDGVGALRLLASMVRVLNRRQLLDLDEIAAEVNESREQAAAEYAAAQAANGEPQQETSESEQAEEPPAEPAET
ncbi:MAG: hypothetical protein ABR567_17275 [Myxococcales bacterium]